MATHSSILAWEIPWTEEPGRLESMGLQRVGPDWAHTHICQWLCKLWKCWAKIFCFLLFFFFFFLRRRKFFNKVRILKKYRPEQYRYYVFFKNLFYDHKNNSLYLLCLAQSLPLTHTISLNENHKGIWWMLKKKRHLFHKGDILLNQGPAFRGSKTHLHRPTPVPNPWLTRLIKSEAQYCSHITIPNT